MGRVFPDAQLDEHLARFLLVTLIVTVALTRGEIVGEVVVASFVALGLLVAYTAVQGFLYGYESAEVGTDS